MTGSSRRGVIGPLGRPNFLLSVGLLLLAYVHCYAQAFVVPTPPRTIAARGRKLHAQLEVRTFGSGHVDVVH